MGSDISYTYRGYRLQALYALWRILKSSHDQIFQPEGVEDLDIFGPNVAKTESIQIKALSTPLTLSSLNVGDSNSFFKRALVQFKLKSPPEVFIVSFGEVGEDLANALKEAGTYRKRVVTRLVTKDNISHQDAELLMEKLRIDLVNENTLRDEINHIISNRFVDPEAGYEILTAWLYKCSEERLKISYRHLINKIDKIGEFLANRSSHIQEWGTAITSITYSVDSIENGDDLKNAYFEGIAARYEHIVSNLDVPRPIRLLAISNGYKIKRVVILHGASGQGKSTLAYRYLHDFYPDYWRYQVRIVEGRQHALSIASALSGYVEAIGIPMIVYVDVSSNDRGWVDLVKRLYEHRNILVLVTIREEDYRSSDFSPSDFEYHEIELQMDKSEAEQIYASLAMVGHSAHVLDFEEVWSRCGGDAPLLEFVYMITKGESLKNRLSAQVNRIRDLVRIGKMLASELEALRLVSVASAYGARLNIVLLSKTLELNDPQRTFELFEKEYLLRTSSEGCLVSGLHPVRSEILTMLLTESTFNKWIDSCLKCIPIMPEQDFEGFLLYAFSRRRFDSLELVNYLYSLHPCSWIGVSGIIKALLWLGVREYVDDNCILAEDMRPVFGDGFSLFMDFDLANVTSGIDNIWNNFTLFPKENIQLIQSVRSRQTDKAMALRHIKSWFSYCDRKLPDYLPSTEDELQSMAYALVWVGHLRLGPQIIVDIDSGTIESTIKNVGIETLGKLMFGLSFVPDCKLKKQFSALSNLLRSKFMNDTHTFKLEENHEKITAHFIVDLFEGNPPVNDKITNASRFHSEAIFRVDLLRQLFPEKDVYACQGYGHKFLRLPNDETQKTRIPKTVFPINDLISINSIFLRLMRDYSRLPDWRSYVSAIMETRYDAIKCLQQLISGLNAYFANKNAVNLFKGYIDSNLWDKVRQSVKIPPMLPFCAFDEWGYVSESDYKKAFDSNGAKRINSHMYAKYNSLLTAVDEYFQSLSNYFNQAQDALIALPHVGRSNRTIEEVIALAKTQHIEIKAGNMSLSLHNINEATRRLLRFQEQCCIHLHTFLDSEEITALINQERQAISKLLYLWYFLIHKPKLITPNAIDELSIRFDLKRQEIMRNLKKAFSKLMKDGLVRIELAKRICKFNDLNAFVVIMDVNKPYDVLVGLRKVLSALFEAISKVEDNEIRRITLEHHFEYFLIIPLVQGRSLDVSAWKFYCHLLPDVNGPKEELIWWRYVPIAIQDAIFDQFAIKKWTYDRLTTARQLIAATQEVSFFTGYLAELINVMDVDNTGTEILQDNAERVSVRLNSSLQSIFDISLEMVNYFNTISDSDKTNRKDIATSFNTVSELVIQLNPSGMQAVNHVITKNNMQEWDNRVTQALQLSIVAYWSWAADVIEQEG